MPSTVIRWFNYKAERQELLIEFQSGRRYAYLAVPEDLFLGLKRAPSKGEFFNANIRDRYRFVRRDE